MMNNVVLMFSQTDEKTPSEQRAWVSSRAILNVPRYGPSLEEY